MIISNSLHEQEMLQEVYSHHNSGQFTFETTASFGQAAHFWFQSAPQVLILNMPEDPALQHFYFEKLKSDVPVTLKIIFLCAAMTPGLMESSTLFERVRLIKTPVTGFFLYRALTDITTDYPPNQQQIHPRYLTDQEILVHSVDENSGSVQAQMKNLSISGAFFEVLESTPSFKVEETIKLSIELVGLRVYQFDAKVVWRKTEGGEDGKTRVGYGCAFNNKEDVYDSLLSQVSRAPQGLY